MSIRCITVLWVAMLVLDALGSALASANVARFPEAVRQTYPDGSNTELRCPAGTPGQSVCTFTLNGDSKRRFALDMGEYSPTLDLSYWYWGSEEERAPITLAIETDCLPLDLEVTPSPTDNWTECRIFFHELDGSLHYRYTEIHDRTVDGPPLSRRAESEVKT